MSIEIKVPLLPESITDAVVSTWHKKVGDTVSRDENIVDLETDKVMLEVPAPNDGVIKQIIKETGSTVHAQEVLAILEPVSAATATSQTAKTDSQTKTSTESGKESSQQGDLAGPAARRAMAANEVTAADVKGTGKGGRITKENVMEKVNQPQAKPPTEQTTPRESGAGSAPSFTTESGQGRPERRVPMTRIRAKIAERLLDVAQNTAMLTTFNEINMSGVMEIRQRYREAFEKKYKVRLGFMSFFVKACVEALKRSPIVNASLDGNDIIYHGYFDIGVAVSTERGLVVPVLRDADKMNMAEIESTIVEYADKARLGKLSLEEMQGGTFTITNGGVFGSLMATPLLNSPQCAILGMHKIQERPVVENGQIVIRPMMYVALSYDHRLIDGKESVSFLVTIKSLLEDPTRIILEV